MSVWLHRPTGVGRLHYASYCLAAELGSRTNRSHLHYHWKYIYFFPRWWPSKRWLLAMLILFPLCCVKQEFLWGNCYKIRLATINIIIYYLPSKYVILFIGKTNIYTYLLLRTVRWIQKKNTYNAMGQIMSVMLLPIRCLTVKLWKILGLPIQVLN